MSSSSDGGSAASADQIWRRASLQPPINTSDASGVLEGALRGARQGLPLAQYGIPQVVGFELEIPERELDDPPDRTEAIAASLSSSGNE